MSSCIQRLVSLHRYLIERDEDMEKIDGVYPLVRKEHAYYHEAINSSPLDFRLQPSITGSPQLHACMVSQGSLYIF